MIPHVLVVDDEPHVARVIQIAMETQGWTVEAVDTLAGARRILGAGPASFDIILLDVKLPDGSGLDYLEEIRKDEAKATLPVVVLSGAEFAHVKETIAELDAHYVAKPFSPSKLSKFILEVVDRRENP